MKLVWTRKTSKGTGCKKETATRKRIKEAGGEACCLSGVNWRCLIFVESSGGNITPLQTLPTSIMAHSQRLAMIPD